MNLTLKLLSSRRFLWPWKQPVFFSKTDVRLIVNKAITGRDATLMSKVFILARTRSRDCPALSQTSLWLFFNNRYLGLLWYTRLERETLLNVQMYKLSCFVRPQTLWLLAVIIDSTKCSHPYGALRQGTSQWKVYIALHPFFIKRFHSF